MTQDGRGGGVSSPRAEATGPPLDDVVPPRRGLGRGALTSLALQGGGTVMQYVAQVALARVLGVGHFGTYTYAVTWSRIAGSMSHVGGASGALRLLPQYGVRQQWAQARGVLRGSRRLALGVGTAIAAIGAGLLLLLGGPRSDASVVALALVMVPLTALIELQVSLTRAFERVFRAFFPWLVLQPVVLVAGVVGARLLGARLSASDAVLITAASYLATVGVQAWWLRSVIPGEIRSAPPSFAAREWFDVTLPIFASNVVYVVFSRLDIVMVGLLRSPRDAGIYAVAMRAGTMSSVLQTATNSMVAPRISRLFWSDRKDEVERLVLTAVGWVFLPTLLVTVVLCGFAGPVLGLFGDAFRSGRTVLVLIALGQLVSVASGPVGWLMNLTGHQRVQAVVFGATAAATLVSYVVLIPWLGIVGAAIANGGAVVVRNIALNLLARRRLGLRISVIRSLRAMSGGSHA